MRLTIFVAARQFKYFQRYIDRFNDVYKLHEYRPLIGWVDKKIKFHYGEHRPWTDAFKNTQLTQRKRIPVEPVKEYHIVKGDRVEILVGKDKGKHGIINCIIKERNWCYVEGLNCEYQLETAEAGLDPICRRDERPLLVTTQVKLIDPSDSKPTDIEWRYTESGERVRVSSRTGRIIPMPLAATETEDGIIPIDYKENKVKDTLEEDLLKVTFEPKLKTFDEEIMDAVGIKEIRKRAKTYWY